MSRIVIAAIGSLGDLHPHLAIALALRQRGHDIVFVTHQAYQAKIEAVGLEFHRLRPDNPVNDESEVSRMMDLRTGTEYIIRQWLLSSLPEMYQDLLASAQNADMIVAGGVVFAAPLVAETLGIPWAVSALQPVAFLSAHDPAVIPFLPFLYKLRGLGLPFNRSVIQLLKVISKSWAAPIHQLRKELKLIPVDDPLLLIEQSDLVLALFSSTFAQPQPDWPLNTLMAGFTFYDDSQSGAALTPELEQFLAAGAAPIVFTLGSAAVMTPGSFYQESIQAAKLLKRRAVLLMGNNAPPGQLPADIMAIDYVPYAWIFPRAGAIVHQGGIGTTAQALRSGCPTLIMPYSHDQPDNAARVERLGTSRTIPRQHYVAARVAKELQELLTDSSYAAKAAEIGVVLQSENGVEMACDAITQKIRDSQAS
jgi:rhamnosyltransferase subunit B